jgi:hypothetical protein
MPKGPGDRAFRKLQNEVQMEWHMHDVNAARAAQPVNSVWLWGGGAKDLPSSPYDRIYGAPGWMRFLGAPVQDVGVERIVAEAPGNGLLIVDALSAPALADDFPAWLAAWREIEHKWLAPLVAALRNGRFDSLGLLLADGERLVEIAASRASLRKFWVRPSLAVLAGTAS